MRIAITGGTGFVGGHPAFMSAPSDRSPWRISWSCCARRWSIEH